MSEKKINSQVIVTKSGKQQKIFWVDLPAWQKDGWSLPGQTTLTTEKGTSNITQGGIKSVLIGLNGIAEKQADEIISKGFDTIEMVKQLSIEELNEIDGIGATRAEKIKEELDAL